MLQHEVNFPPLDSHNTLMFKQILTEVKGLTKKRVVFIAAWYLIQYSIYYLLINKTFSRQLNTLSHGV
jgi:hypothetical protein